MSTNPKDITTKEKWQTVVEANKQEIDASVRELQTEVKQENTLVQETPIGKLQRVLKAYGGVKKLLSVLAKFPFIPPLWRSGIVILNQALEALSASAEDVTATFKAGKDV